MAAASSSTSFFSIIDEDHLNQLKHHPPLPSQHHAPATAGQPLPSSATTNPPKKKRNLPGNPNPDAEVIALSPKTLMATNRFICEVCNKGFQREQNLQLHRRGHNLPWKLKQKSSKEVRRRVYLCPEPSCVHHDPSRALGDLTGIKKHFSRKHGEKKWKCDKCSKRYAVQSDWKAHSKTCGTREYRCDCGTLFSRRDSFITHRAFCDALAQESSRLPTIGSHFYRSNNNNNNFSLGHHLSSLHYQNQNHQISPDLLRLGGTAAASCQTFSAGPQYIDHLHPPPPPANSFFLTGDDTLQSKASFQGLMHLPDLQPNLGFFTVNNNQSAHLMENEQVINSSGNLMNDQMQALLNNAVLPQMSATALLQKAAEMGATSSLGEQSLRSQVENHEKQLMDIMNSFANGNSGVFGGGGEEDEEVKFGEFDNAGLCNMEEGRYQNNGLTRDFLGVGSMLRSMGGGMALDNGEVNKSLSSNRLFHTGSFASGRREIEEEKMRQNGGNEFR
ncbi:hypothetical protein KFK09_017808 [Dendrobium nobile]|uniref:Protein EARLY HEADING DATE 2 n=1 Tax=Dendrobium nobile TaxID=94219 RepID=A0A8T3AV48_DENNO|nr:hypothetical protein KFK09_017808 [Dendrobium nobile]